VGSSIKSQSGNSFPKRQQNNNRSQDSLYKKKIRTCFKCNHQGHIASYCPTSQNVKFKPGKLGLCIEQTQNQVSDEKSEGVKRYVSGVTVRLPGMSAIDHTEKKVSGIEIVDISRSMFLNPKFKIFVAPIQQLLSHHTVKQFLKVYANIFPLTPISVKTFFSNRIFSK
jgi:hypothetical protein